LLISTSSQGRSHLFSDGYLFHGLTVTAQIREILRGTNSSKNQNYGENNKQYFLFFFINNALSLVLIKNSFEFNTDHRPPVAIFNITSCLGLLLFLHFFSFKASCNLSFVINYSFRIMVLSVCVNSTSFWQSTISGLSSGV